MEKFKAEISPEYARLIYLTSPLHDIGKVGIPDHVLLKPGRLSDDEFGIMKTHAALGAQTLDAALRQFPRVKFLEMGRDIAASHHERYDGTGYPGKLKGDQIPLCGRIVALADVYDALTSRRVYKAAITHDIARNMIVNESGSHFDPAVVQAFVKNEGRFIAVRETHCEHPSRGGGMKRWSGFCGFTRSLYCSEHCPLDDPTRETMRIFHCDHCGALIFFENVLCENCRHKLAYLPDLKLVASLDPVFTSGPQVELTLQQWTSPVPHSEGKKYRLCKNYVEFGTCNWAVLPEESGPYCASCRLTHIIPDLKIVGNMHRWARLENAKRRLVYSLMEHRLAVRDKTQDPEHGLRFQFMGDPPNGPKVLTGHDNGVITVNIVEADDDERERRRIQLREPYRTLLGHFRHEIGHYYWDLLIKDSQRIEAFRDRFGDERPDYDESLKKHYKEGPKPGWHEQFVSEYASVHPWEDWAETWAHYLHMTDTLETAAACGLSLLPDRRNEPTMLKQPRKSAREQSFDEIITNWFPLTYALNSLNRGMGMLDAYPFVLSPPVIEKLRFIHDTICACDPAMGR